MALPQTLLLKRAVLAGEIRFRLAKPLLVNLTSEHFDAPLVTKQVHIILLKPQFTPQGGRY
jgi:hypothetical protein